MFSTPKIAHIEIAGDSIKISSKELSVSFKYHSITMLYINTEQDQTAREMEVSMNKIKRHEHDLADLLRFQMTVHDVSFSFTANRMEGDKIALFFENDLGRRFLDDKEIVPGSITAELKRELEAEDQTIIHYPIYFYAYTGTGFGADDDGEDETDD